MTACLPIFNFLIFFFVFRYCGFPEVCFTSEFKTFLHGAEKVCANFVEVFQGSHYVCRACNGLKRVAGLEFFRITTFEFSKTPTNKPFVSAVCRVDRESEVDMAKNYRLQNWSAMLSVFYRHMF